MITVKINNKNFNLYVSEDAKEKVKNLANSVDQKVQELRKLNDNAPLDLLLLMVALKLEDNSKDKALDLDIEASKDKKEIEFIQTKILQLNKKITEILQN